MVSSAASLTARAALFEMASTSTGISCGTDLSRRAKLTQDHKRLVFATTPPSCWPQNTHTHTERGGTPVGTRGMPTLRSLGSLQQITWQSGLNLYPLLIKGPY